MTSVSDDNDRTLPPTKRRTRSSVKKTRGASASSVRKSKPPDQSPPPKKRRSKKATVDADDDAGTCSSNDSSAASTTSNKPKKKTAKAAEHQRQTERDDLPKLWSEQDGRKNGSYTYKIASWNVAGLRALMKKQPDALANLCKKHDLDMLCLQETKLQESHLDDPKLKIRGHLLVDEGYDSYYSCSTTKKGYSGTAVFVKRHGKDANKSSKQADIASFFTKKENAPKASSDNVDDNKTDNTAQLAPPKDRTEGVSADLLHKLVPDEVTYNIGKDIDNEGRVIVLDFPFMSVANVYVPNSGQKLQRLDMRINEWDVDWLEFMKARHEHRGVPVLWLGDLNVAHTNMEVWNDGAKHLAKQAGVTPQERESFQRQLDAGFVDAFRKLHPTAKGQYSYWSQRAGNRAPNKGLRLDYFICSSDMFADHESPSNVVVRDSYILDEQEGSDHCPVVLELEIKDV